VADKPPLPSSNQSFRLLSQQYRSIAMAHRKLVTFESLATDDEWSFLADNEFIHKHYRRNLSCCDALRSLFICHNELVNVWTHTLGAILFIILLVRLVVVVTYVPSFRTGSTVCC